MAREAPESLRLDWQGGDRAPKRRAQGRRQIWKSRARTHWEANAIRSSPRTEVQTAACGFAPHPHPLSTSKLCTPVPKGGYLLHKVTKHKLLFAAWRQGAIPDRGCRNGIKQGEPRAPIGPDRCILQHVRTRLPHAPSRRMKLCHAAGLQDSIQCPLSGSTPTPPTSPAISHGMAIRNTASANRERPGEAKLEAQVPVRLNVQFIQV